LIEFDIEPLWFFRKMMFFSVAMETVEIEKKFRHLAQVPKTWIQECHLFDDVIG
jgi:hypothetical protein